MCCFTASVRPTSTYLGLTPPGIARNPADSLVRISRRAVALRTETPPSRLLGQPRTGVKVKVMVVVEADELVCIGARQRGRSSEAERAATQADSTRSDRAPDSVPCRVTIPRLRSTGKREIDSC